jgi:hypothetical protein
VIARMITTCNELLALVLAAVLVLGVQISPAATFNTKAAGAPGIAEEPIGRNVSEGGHVTLSLSVTGAAPFSFQWWKNGEPLTDNSRVSGATSPVLNIDPAITNDTGSYFAIVTNSSGAVTSAVVSVTWLRLGIALAVRGNTGLFVRVFGQIGDVYRIESANDPNAGPWITNAFATNYNGVAAVFVPFVGLRTYLRPQFDHMLPVLYPPDRNDSSHVIRAYGKLNQVWQLQGSLNLPSWETASSPQTNTTGWVKFRENLPNNPVRRFYRIVPP